MIYFFIAIVFYTAAILLGAAASRNLNTNVASGIMNTLSAVIPLAVALPYITKKTVSDNQFGVIMAVCAGIAIAISTLALNKVGVVAPVIFGGAILCSTVLSYFVFREKISVLEGVGLAAMLIGLALVVYARAIAK